MPRGRKPAVPLEATPEPAAPVTPATDAPAPIRRRRRRRTTGTGPDYSGETVKLVEAVLKSRGARGATQDTLQSVITWARGIREEGDALRDIAGRPRRPKIQAPSERIAAYEMNRALLDGILQGAIVLDVQEDGTLVFLHMDSLTARPSVVEVIEVLDDALDAG